MMMSWQGPVGKLVAGRSCCLGTLKSLALLYLSDLSYLAHAILAKEKAMQEFLQMQIKQAAIS